MGQNDTMIRVDMGTEWWERLVSVLVGVVVAIVTVIVVVALGAALAAVAAVVIPAITVSASIGAGTIIIAAGTGVIAGVAYYNTQFPEDLMLPVYSISPEEIFKGQILLFDVDFFNPVTEIKVHTDKVDGDGNRTGDGAVYNLSDYETDQELAEALADDEQIRDYFYEEDGEEIITSKQNVALELQALVSQWYSAIRNIAIVLSMSVLLYIGIRMLLSTVAQDKAKYKQMLIDWVVSLCLLFFMHYIMAFSVSVVNEFTKVITISNTDNGTGYAAVLELDEDGNIEDKMEDIGMTDAIVDDHLMWPTNLMGQLRIQAQMSYGDASFIGYGLCFFILTLLTIFFVFTYLKRVLYMAFLTMIAPLVALTYPIDKISDGQAQAFNRWLKEYIFNLLIQPLHLLIYTILVTSAFDLAGKNVLYSLAAIGFLIPAEKLMRSFFGFEKASTPGSLAGAAVGAGLINTGLNQLLHRAPPGKGGKDGNNGSDGDNASAPARIGYRNNDFDPLDGMANDNSNLDDGDGGAPLTPLDSGGGSEPESQGPNYEEDAMQKYKSEGFNQNALGEYYNPYTDEYDSEYNPLEDPGYNQRLKNEEDAMQKYKSEGFNQNALGEYFNPDTNEYDSEYNPLQDPYYNKNLRDLEEKQAKEEQAKQVKQAEEETIKESRKAQGRQTPKIKGSRGRMTAGDVVKGTGRNLKYRLKQGMTGYKQGLKKGIRQAPGVLGGAVLGATAGAVGLAAGIAAGDPSKAFSYAAGAGIAGASFGSKAFTISPRSGQPSAEKIARDRAFYGDKYDDHIAEKNMKKWKRDDEKRQELERYLGREGAKSLYKDKKIDQYLKNEITDAKDIAALEKLQKEKNVNFNDAMVFYDAYDKYGDITRQKPKDRADIEGGYTKEFTDRGNSQQHAEGKAKRITKMTHEFESLKKNLR